MAEQKGGRVLMAAYYFPPLSGSGVFRSIRFAKYHLKLLQICMLFQILDNIIGPGQRGAWEGQQVRYALLAPRYLGENPICRCLAGNPL